MRPRTRILLAWLPAALYMVAIWIASSFAIQSPLVREFPLRDKGLHFVEYAVLGFLVAHAALKTWPSKGTLRTVAVGALIAIGWGLLDELHQSLVPGRASELLDLVADVLGATVGASLRLGVRHARAERVGARTERSEGAALGDGATSAGEDS